MPRKIVEIAEPFVCGGSAATFASCVIHPMDLAKVSEEIEITHHGAFPSFQIQ